MRFFLIPFLLFLIFGFSQRIQKLDAGEDAKKHTPSLLKKFMAVMPKSAGKSESSSCSSNCPMSSSMSLGSTHLTLRNFKEKTFSMSGGLIVQSYDVVLKISANLELEFLAKHEGFLVSISRNLSELYTRNEQYFIFHSMNKIA